MPKDIMVEEEYKDDPEHTWQQLQAVLNGEDTFLTEQEQTALERRYRLGAAVEAIGQTHDIGYALTLQSVDLLLPIVQKLARAMTDHE